MNISTGTPERHRTIYGLAVVGFIALVVAGMWLAFYSTRFIPGVADRIGVAAVYLTSVFAQESAPALSVVPSPTAPTIISFDQGGSAASTTPVRENSSPLPRTSTPRKPTQPTAGAKTNSTFDLSSAGATRALSGLPDLVVTVNAIGYFAGASTDSFVASSTVPVGNRPAITFTIKNIGTNASGSWRFSASIPTQSFFLYQSQPQQSLAPGDSIDYTLGFDQSNKGTGQMISITANFDRTVGESNTNNNSASATVTVLGS